MMKKGLLVLVGASLLMGLVSCGNNSAHNLSNYSYSSYSIPDIGSSSDAGGGEEGGDAYVYKGHVRIYYRNDESSYATRRIYVWATGLDGTEYKFDGSDDYGVYKDFDLSAAPFGDLTLSSLSFIIKYAGTWAGQSSDTLVPFSKYKATETTDSGGNPLLVVYSSDTGNGSVDCYAARSEAEGDRLESAAFSDWKTLRLSGTGKADGRAASEIGKISSYEIYAFTADYYALSDIKQGLQKGDYLVAEGKPSSNSVDVTFANDITPSLHYLVECVFASDTTKTKRKAASFVSLYGTQKFIDEYTYGGSDLGLSYTSDAKWQWKLWAPTAYKVDAYVYIGGTPQALDPANASTDDDHTIVHLTAGEKGLWTGTREIDSAYNFYTYMVYNEAGSAETIDPYAKACGVNGVRTAILSPAALASTDPSGFRASLKNLPAIKNLNELSIYEAHIRDFTADKTWTGKEKAGTYNAFAESGTTYSDGASTVTTGFDSLKELHVNAVQLLPVFDQDNDERTYETTVNGAKTTVSPSYNWGYNPLNYNCVEGAYSSDPYSATTRIKEYKGLIQKCADNGMRVIMDVVYNHMSSVSNNAFNKVMPKYYFKTDASGAYVDETGINNTFDSTKLMARRFIKESVLFWAVQYGIKGFRFDLMGALETSLMREIKDELYAYDPSIVVYGEGWRGSGSPSSSEAGTGNVYASLYDNGKGAVGCFNDHGRDGIKGNTSWGSVNPSYGFITHGPSDVSADDYWNSYCVALGENRNQGSNPVQTVNYIACHDNYTLYDQLNYCINGGLNSDQPDNLSAISAAVAAQAWVNFGQGAAFIQGGDEIFRQKVMKSTDPLVEKLYKEDASGTRVLGDDALAIADGNYLIRNSYMYGDDVNSFKWDRKITYKSYFDKIAESFQVRNSLMGTIFGYATKALVDSKISTWTPNGAGVACIAAANNGYAMFMGGEMSGASLDMGGTGSYTVVYSSTGGHSGTASSTVIGKWETLLLKVA
jgi:pullulanase/glycogen debranching enzyme